jgi:AraC-like DNA-binding protein
MKEIVKIYKSHKEEGDVVFEPKVLYAGDEALTKPGSVFGPIIRDIFIIECCTEGFGSVVINDTAFPVKPGDAYILLPGDKITHKADINQPRRGYWCALDGMQVKTAVKLSGISSKNPFAPPELFDEICAHVQALFEMKADSDAGSDFRRLSHAYGILGALLRSTAINDKSLWVHRAIGYMEANYPEEITVESIAGEIGLDRSYFSTLFKSQMGISPHAYLNSLRVKKAAELIKSGLYPISSVAEAVGLDSMNFARVFKKEFNMTPREYQNKNTGKENE